MDKLNLTFGNEFIGDVNTDDGVIKIGRRNGGFVPYELLMGALGSCLYSTFLDILKKMRLDFTACRLDIEWEKRDEVPKMTKLVIIKVTMNGADVEKKERIEHAFQLATEYCSVFQTLSKVAEMKYEVAFE